VAGWDEWPVGLGSGLGSGLLGQEVGMEEEAEDAGGLGFGCFVAVDEEALEDGLVDLAAYLVAGVAVGGVAVGEEGQPALERVLDLLEDDAGGGEALFGVGDRLGDAVLLLLEQVKGQRSGVVGFEELAALPR
jgi:hypothetical protein